MQKETTRLSRLGTGHNLNEWIGRLAFRAGNGSAVAEESTGIALNFLRNEGSSDNV